MLSSAILICYNRTVSKFGEIDCVDDILSMISTSIFYTNMVMIMKLLRLFKSIL